MAGFDFEFRYADPLQPLLDVCLQAAKSRARTLLVSWRTEHTGSATMRCVVDGQTRRLDLLGHALERDLPLIAEGADRTALPAARRKRLGLGFADLYARGRDIRTEGLMHWRGVSHTKYYFAPYETQHPAAPEDLRARLAVTEIVLIDWALERTPAVVVLEELHTAFELLLEHLVNQRSKRLSFAQLVEAAFEAGILDRPNMDGAAPGQSRADYNKALLITLKDYRKNARHRGNMSFEPWLTTVWEELALLVEVLVDADPVSTRPG